VLTKTAELGLSADEAASLFEPGKLNVAPLKPPTDTSDSQIGLAFGIAVLLFYMIMQFGIAIAQGVVEEKSSRVLELLISRMDTRTFLTGKVVGIGLVGLGQMTFFAMVALVLLRIVDSPALDNASWDLAVVSVLWFVVGFFVYAGLYLIAGAIAGRPEDLQSTTFLAVAVGSLSYVAASVAVGNPDADWVRLASLIPFSAPLLQPMRWAHGTAQAADLLIGLVLALGATAVLIRLAATIYDHNVLNRTKTGMLQTLRHRTTGKTIHR
jgi:ABC-2 type transport system permease protein